MYLNNMEKNNNLKPVSLYQLCWEFFKIGTIGFGGGWVIISLIHNRFVKEKRLISDEEFAIGLSLSQFLGAFAVNTTSFIGRKLRGIWGAILSTIFFLLPSFTIVCILSHFYFRHNKILNFENLLKGISPVIISLLISTVFDLSIKTKKDFPFCFILFFVLIAGLFNLNYIFLLIISGIFQILFFYIQQRKSINTNNLFLYFFSSFKFSPGFLSFSMLPGTISISSIALTFLGIGFIFFGGGYSLIPLLQNIFVNKLNWISNQDYIFGIAISQTTPGPFAVIATFLGYYLKGIPGAFIATVMIFLPSFILLQILISFQNNLKDNQYIQAFLGGVYIAIIGQLILISYHFFIDTMLPLSIPSVLLLIISLVCFFIYKTPPIIFILLGIFYGFFTS